MSRFNFVSPGAAVQDELQRVLAEREAKRRQDFLDSITKNREDRNDEVQREQVKSLTEQREVMNQTRKQDMATQLAKMMRPTQQLDDPSVQTLEQGGLGILVKSQQSPLHEALGPGVQDVQAPDGSFQTQAAPAVMDRQTFTGTPDQLKEQEDQKRKLDYLSKLDPNSVEAKVLAYETNTGKNAPAGMTAQPPSPGAAAQEYQFYAAEETKAGRTPLSFDEYQARDANRKRAVVQPNTDAGFTPRQTVTFNQIAGAYERSPLMRAADRTIVLRDAAKAIQANPSDPASQLALAYSWIQALDTYQSAVREGELQLMSGLATRWQNLMMEAQKVATTGAVMPPEIAQQIAANAGELIRTIEAGRDRKGREFASRAKVSGVGKMWDEFVGGFGEPEAAPPPAAGPAAPGAAPAAQPSSGLPPGVTVRRRN